MSPLDVTVIFPLSLPVTTLDFAAIDDFFLLGYKGKRDYWGVVTHLTPQHTK